MLHRRPAVLARLYTPAGRALSAFTAFAVALTSGAGVLSRAAYAADLPRVLVLPYAPVYDGLAASVGEKTADVLANELKSSEQLQLVTAKKDLASVPVKKPVNPGPARDQAVLTEAKERAAKADDLVKKLKFREAATELEKVLSLMEGQHPYIDFGELVGAYLNVAVAYFRLGLDSEGEKALAQVVRLDPERKLDAEKYPPVFIRAYDNVSKKLKKTPRSTGAIEVKPTVAGALVALDGREVGRAPILIKDVVKGTHFLRVGDGWANKVEVAGGETAHVAPDLGSAGGPVAEMVGLLARNTIDDLVIARALALAEAAPADFVVLGGVHKEGDAIVVSSHLLKVATKKTCLLQRVVFDQEMLGAGIEVYKVGTDITNKLDVFGDVEKLPAKVARDALPPAAGSKPVAAVSASGGTETGPAVATADPADRLVRRNGDAPPTDKPKPADAPTAVKTDAKPASGDPEMIPLGPPTDEPKKVEGGSKAWVWIVVAAVVVAAGAGVGGYFAYDAATKPVTGKGTITW